MSNTAAKTFSIQHVNLEYARKVLQVYNARSRPLSDEIGLPGTAFDILMFLYNNPDYHTARDIVRVRGIKASLVSVNVDRLVEDGYLLREHDPDDRRKYRLTLTPKAMAVGAKGRVMQDAFFAELLDGIDDEQLAILEQIFVRAGDNLEKMEGH